MSILNHISQALIAHSHAFGGSRNLAVHFREFITNKIFLKPVHFIEKVKRLDRERLAIYFSTATQASKQFPSGRVKPGSQLIALRAWQPLAGTIKSKGQSFCRNLVEFFDNRERCHSSLV